ncbi:MAG TPA: WbqC family protein [Flavobacteriales bacterium]|nr:WbqC family protein [Flavobacteriales bacterium]
MTLAIMQPYLFPYIGYFQLLHACDCFVSLNDANFIKRGWINRNRILLDGRDHLFTVPLRNVSQHASIQDTLIAPDDGWKRKLIQQMQHAYRKAPLAASVLPMVTDLIAGAEGSIADFAEASLRATLQIIGIDRPFLRASTLQLRNDLRGQDRIVAICEQLGARTYVNPPGGRDLYQVERFNERGLDLRFLKVQAGPYNQGVTDFIPGLSIIDVLMWNQPEQVRGLVEQYTLDA